MALTSRSAVKTSASSFTRERSLICSPGLLVLIEVGTMGNVHFRDPTATITGCRCCFDAVEDSSPKYTFDVGRRRLILLCRFRRSEARRLGFVVGCVAHKSS